jgi:hypothetical protein
MLNYDETIILDAEELGEGSIGSSYVKDIVPVLTRFGISPAEIKEDFEPESERYTVTSQGRTYLVYSAEMDLSEGQNWGNATFALFDIVNRQLEGSPYRFYALNSGNDLTGIFLTIEEREKEVSSSKLRQVDWPYLPGPSHPWYGQLHGR